MKRGDDGSDPPRVSVITTTYRTPADLLLASLRSVLDQTLKELELIVVADGPLDEAQQHAIDGLTDDPRVRLMSPGRVGRANALNVAIGAAEAPLIAVQDADDASHVERLERQVRVLERRADLDLVGTGVRRSDNPTDDVRWPLPPARDQVKLFDKRLLIANPLVHSSVMARRSMVESIGGYSNSRRYQFDHDLYLRMRRAGMGLGRLTDQLVLKRVHADQAFEAGGPAAPRLVSAWRLQVSHARAEPLPQRLAYLGAATVRLGARATRSVVRRARGAR